MMHELTLVDSFFQKITTIENDTGLHLYPLPTGFGKTFSISHTIAEYRRQGGTRPIIVCSPQNKHIDGIYDDLLSLTSKENMDANVLHIKKNEECFDDFDDFLDSDDAEAMIKSDNDCETTFHHLQSALAALQQFHASKHLLPLQIREETENQAGIKFWQAEHAFRTVYQKFFKDNCPLPHLDSTKDPTDAELEKFKMLFREAIASAVKQHPWMARFYPSMRIFTCRTFLINTSKLLRTLATIVPGVGSQTLGDYLTDQKPILFLDEFDSNRSVFESYIIESMLRSEANMIELFRSIYTFLKSEEKWSVDVQKSVNGYKRTKNLQEQADKLFHHYFSHAWNYRLPISSMEDKNSKFTFLGDYNIHSISNVKGKRYSAAKWSVEKGQYIIQMYSGSEYQPIKNDSSYIPVPKMLSNLQWFFRDFSKCVGFWSRKYRSIKQEELEKSGKPKGVADITLDEAQDSLLRQIFSSTDRSKALISSMAESSMMASGAGKRSIIRENDGSYFLRGYWLNRFINDSHNMEQTDITFASRVKTPEMIALNLAETMLVIGTSATAEIINPDNFYLPFFAKHLGKKFSLGNGNELISRFLRQLKDGYRKYGVHIHDANIMDGQGSLATCNENTYDLLMTVFKNASYCKRFARELDAIYGGQNRSYRIGMYYDCFVAMRDFIISPNARAWLFLNSPKLSDTKINRDPDTKELQIPNHPESFYRCILEGAMQELVKEYGLPGNRPVLLANITSENYEAEVDTLKKRLLDGARIMVFAAYKTLMTGTNLQFTPNVQDIIDGIYVDVMNDEKREHASDSRHETADFDGIFLGYMSGVSPSSSLATDADRNGRDSKSASYEMHKMIGVIKTAAQANVIPEQVGTSLVRQLISKTDPLHIQIRMKSAFQNASAYYANFALKNVVQSIGRISRSFLKNRDISIYIHRGLHNICIRDDLAFLQNKSLLIPELEKLTEQAIIHPTKEEDEHWHLQVIFQNKCAEGDASRFLRNFFSQKGGIKKSAMQPWMDIRRMLLKVPTNVEAYHPMTDWQELVQEFQFLHSPYELTSYAYIEGDDFNYCFPYLDRFFSKDEIIQRNSLKYMNLHYGQVSEEDCKLPLLMSDPLLRKRFEDLGYATSWTSAKSIMNPNLYRSFYKGSLGEVCGEAILRQFGIPSKEIEVPDLFEKFDFLLPFEIYLDMKHWHYGFFVPRETFLEKVSKKLDEIDAYNEEHHPNYPKSIGIVANLIEEQPHFNDAPILEDYREFNGHRIYEVPWLFRTPGEYNFKFLLKLQSLIKERELHYEPNDVFNGTDSNKPHPSAFSKGNIPS